MANLIQGSVRQQGDRIRVTVGMIRAADGSSVWSHTYDDQLKDVFAIQTQMGGAVAAALNVQLLGQTLGVDDKPPSGNVEAYRLMLQGRALNRTGIDASMRKGIGLYEQALAIAPNYAYAWGTLSNAWINLGLDLTGAAQQQAFAQAHVAADKQQALAPDAVDTHMIRGYLRSQVDNDFAGALAEYQRGYALAPNDGTAMSFLATGLSNLGQLQAAAELYRKAIVTDPLRPDFYLDLASVLLGQRTLDASEQATQKALALQPDFPGLYANLAAIDVLRGDAPAAVRAAKQETDPQTGPLMQVMAQQIGPDRKQADLALHGYIAEYGKTQPYNVAELYALREQPDAMFEWLRRAWTQRDPNFIAYLLEEPFTLPYQHHPRFAALCKDTGLPLPDNVQSAAVNRSSSTATPATSSAPTSNP